MPQAGTNGRVIVPSRCYYHTNHHTTLQVIAWTTQQNFLLVKFTAPFNLRADGYQGPSGSSHAGAAANGSGRKAAYYSECFSIGPSITGIMDTDGVISQFPWAVLHACVKFSEFISVWYERSPMLRAPSKFPVGILYPLDYLPTPNAAQTRLIGKFVDGLESALQRLEARRLLGCNMRRNTESLLSSTELCIGSGMLRKQARYVLASFQIYRHWLLDKVFKTDPKDSVAIMIFPIEVGKPNYRDSELPYTRRCPSC
ncbi:hypothetical protein V8E54_011396 [Elaphomyces granulatus]